MNAENNNQPERRTDRIDIAKWQGHVDTRLDSQDATLRNIRATQGEIGSKLDVHISETKAFRKEVAPMVETLDSIQGGIKVLGWLGKPVFWIVTVVAAIATTVATLTGIHFGK